MGSKKRRYQILFHLRRWQFNVPTWQYLCQ